MNRRYDRPILVCLLLTVGLAACAAPVQPVSRIDRVQQGDGKLSCEQIKGQIAAMDGVIRQSNGAAQDANADLGKTGGENHVAALGTGVAGIPLVGGVFGAIAGNKQNRDASAQMQAGTDADDAKARKENLVSLGNGKGCF
jgi:hypothetical protein